MNLLLCMLCLQPSRHGPDFHRPQSQITIESPDCHPWRSQKCLLGREVNDTLYHRNSSNRKTDLNIQPIYSIHQWCANKGISNPNPDTSNPNAAESKIHPFFLESESSPAGHTSGVIGTRIRIHHFFLESEFLLSSSESESGSEPNPKGSESGFKSELGHHW